MKLKNGMQVLSLLFIMIFVGMIFIPAVSAQQDIDDLEIAKTSLTKLLNGHVNDYNNAVSEQNHKKIVQSVEMIDSILLDLSKIGYTVDFSSTSQIIKGQNSDSIPTTVTFEIKKMSKENVKQGHSYTANEEQLKIYNEIKDDQITTGEFLEKVFPEALNGMPESTKQFIYQQPLKGSECEEDQISVRECSGDVQLLEVPLPIVVHPESSLDQRLFSMTVDFESNSRVWLPNPWYTIPYMSVASDLEKDDGITYALDYKDGYNVYEMKAGFAYTVLSSGNYKTTGGHIAEVGPLYIPPSQEYSTDTGWKYIS
jgi:hypothetical protein